MQTNTRNGKCIDKIASVCAKKLNRRWLIKHKNYNMVHIQASYCYSTDNGYKSFSTLLCPYNVPRVRYLMADSNISEKKDEKEKKIYENLKYDNCYPYINKDSIKFLCDLLISERWRLGHKKFMSMYYFDSKLEKYIRKTTDKQN